MLSERSQAKSECTFVTPGPQVLESNQLLWQKAPGEGQEGGVAKGARKFGVMDVFPILVVMVVSLVHASIKTYQTGYFNQEQVVVCWLYHSKAGGRACS